MASRFLSPKGLRALLEPAGLTWTEFNRMGHNGLAPRPIMYCGPRMPRWATAQVVAFLADLDAKTIPSEVGQ